MQCNIFAYSPSVPTFVFETFRSSRLQTFFKIGVIKNFAIFTFPVTIAKCLTLSWRRPLSYRHQSIDFLYKSMDWFLYDNGLRHERVKNTFFIELLQWLLQNFHEVHWGTDSRYRILPGTNQVNVCKLWFLVESYEEILSGKI